MIDYSQKNYQKGFTLIEMLVSIALFAVVVTISVGTLLVLVDANAKAQSIQIAINNLSFAVDSITRNMRMGTDFYCGANQNAIVSGGDPGVLQAGAGDCSGSQTVTAIAFTDTRTGNRIGYAMPHPAGTSIQRKVDVGGGVGGEWHDLTGSNITINQLDIQIDGTNTGPDTEQPLISVYIDASVGDVTGLGSQFQIQTTVAQRKLDL